MYSSVQFASLRISCAVLLRSGHFVRDPIVGMKAIKFFGQGLLVLEENEAPHIKGRPRRLLFFLKVFVVVVIHVDE